MTEEENENLLDGNGIPGLTKAMGGKTKIIAYAIFIGIAIFAILAVKKNKVKW